MFRGKARLSSVIALTAALWVMAACAVRHGAVSSGARSPETGIRAPYPDNVQGLKQELKDMREAARKGRSGRLRAMITDLEIPDARAWYLANFGTSGPGSADLYEKFLATREPQLEDQMIEFAREQGYFSVKKQDAKKVYGDLITEPELFLAAWEQILPHAEVPDETPFGYFFFVRGKFRWDSTREWIMLD